MSDFNTVRDLPNNQDAYFNWRNGWIFGLPDSDHPQSEECGAMPFRYGKPQNTVNAQKCLRGEDWAFLNSFCTMYKNLPSSTIWPRNDPAVPQLVQSPARLEIQRMYDYLKHFEQILKKTLASSVRRKQTYTRNLRHKYMNQWLFNQAHHWQRNHFQCNR